MEFAGNHRISSTKLGAEPTEIILIILIRIMYKVFKSKRNYVSRRRKNLDDHHFPQTPLVLSPGSPNPKTWGFGLGPPGRDMFQIHGIQTSYFPYENAIAMLYHMFRHTIIFIMRMCWCNLADIILGRSFRGDGIEPLTICVASHSLIWGYNLMVNFPLFFNVLFWSSKLAIWVCARRYLGIVWDVFI